VFFIQKQNLHTRPPLRSEKKLCGVKANDTGDFCIAVAVKGITAKATWKARSEKKHLQIAHYKLCEVAKALATQENMVIIISPHDGHST